MVTLIVVPNLWSYPAPRQGSLWHESPLKYLSTQPTGMHKRRPLLYMLHAVTHLNSQLV